MGCVAARERVRQRLPAAIADVAGAPVLGDEADDLGPGQVRHLPQVPPHRPLIGLAEAVLLEADQRAAHEGAGGRLVGEFEVRRLVALQERPDLVERANPFGTKCHDHPPMISSPRTSGSLPRWKPSPRSGSFAFGQDSPLTPRPFVARLLAATNHRTAAAGSGEMVSGLPPYVDRLLSRVAAVVTVVAVAAVVADLADGPDLPAIPLDHRPKIIRDWEEVFRSTGEGYTVRIAVFSDYKCPCCADAAQDMRTLGQEYSDVLIEYRSLPTLGELSERAAAVAECARPTGRYEEMHRILFDIVDSLGVVPWTRLEAQAGIVDTLSFRSCLHEPSEPPRISQDLAVAEQLGVTATPSILVDSLLFRGSPGLSYLDAYIATCTHPAPAFNRLNNTELRYDQILWYVL